MSNCDGRVARRLWPRRLTVVVLTMSLSAIVLLGGFSAWVVSVTVPVVVVDGEGNPLADVAIFDWQAALGEEPLAGCGLMRLFTAPSGTGGYGSALLCIAVDPEGAAPNSGPATARPAIGSGFGCCLGGGFSGSDFSGRRTPRVRVAQSGFIGWLNRCVRPFGVALAWDWTQPVQTGGSGAARVPDSSNVTAISLGDLKAKPGQVFVMETAAAKQSAAPAKIVIRPVPAPLPGLDKQINWNSLDVRLSDFIGAVAGESGIQIDFDWAALEEEGIEPSTPVSIELSDVSLRNALRFVLANLNLTFIQQSHSLLVTSQNDAGNRLEKRLYDLRDLLTSTGEDLEYDVAELEELLQRIVSPSSWNSVGGPGELFVSAAERAMVVNQTAAVHEGIELALAMLRTGKNPPFGEAERRLRQALAVSANLDFTDTPLGTVIRTIKNLAGAANIACDKLALEEEGVTMDTRVNAQIHAAPLESALRIMLADLNLTWIIKDDVLVITSRNMAGNELFHRAYPVADLLGSPPDPDTLIQTLQQTISANSWDCVGGAGSTELFTSRSLLVVSQTEAVHAQIAQLFDSLRHGTQPGETDADRATRAALKTPVSLDFVNMRLDDAVRFLATQAGVKNVHFDRIALECERVRLDSPVTMRGQRISAGAALRFMLGQLDLACDVSEGTLVVTCQAQSENYQIPRLYRADDLLGDPADWDTLIQLLQTMIAPNSWDCVGGPGTVEAFPAKYCVVVTQTAAAQDSIAELLARLRGQPQPRAPAELAILNGLQTIRDWRFDGSLSQLADRLADGLGHTVILDHVALHDQAISPSQPVTIVARNEPLETALQRGLNRVEASFVVLDEALVIKGQNLQRGFDPYRARVYSARSLAWSDQDADELVELIQEHIAPDDWSSVGGAGNVSYFPVTGHVVVYHTDRVHCDVERFLAKLTQSRDNQGR